MIIGALLKIGVYTNRTGRLPILQTTYETINLNPQFNRQSRSPISNSILNRKCSINLKRRRTFSNENKHILDPDQQALFCEVFSKPAVLGFGLVCAW